MLVPWDSVSFVMSQDTKPCHPTEAICHLQTYLAWHHSSLTHHRPKTDVIMHTKNSFCFPDVICLITNGGKYEYDIDVNPAHTHTQQYTWTDILSFIFYISYMRLISNGTLDFHTCTSTGFMSQIFSRSFVIDNPHEKYPLTRLM